MNTDRNMSEAVHTAALAPADLLTQCRVTRTRGSGPGGQHRNKVETAIVIQHQPTGIRGEASERRSQAANQKVALMRLRINLAIETRYEKSSRDEVSALWTSRIRDGRIHVNPAHDDFPALLAEALDWLAAHGCNPKSASDKLGCTVSQLIKFLKRKSRALAHVNENRRLRGLHPLK